MPLPNFLSFASTLVMNDEHKKLVDIVAKLLALADGGATEAEAESARAKAALLIAKYDISMADAKDLEAYQSDTEFRLGGVTTHEHHLLGALGKFCGVLVLSTSRMFGGKAFKFFGKPRDLASFHYMRGNVQAQQQRAWMSYLLANPGSGRTKASWKYSYAEGVCQKVRALMRDAKVQQRALRQDLVLVPRERQAHEEYEVLFGKIGSGNGYGGEENAHGLESGRNVSLSKGVHSGGGRVLQITKGAHL
jgi:hypothetical protein